jgi:hypothetical protein
MAQSLRELTREETEALRELARPGLTKRMISEKVLKRLIKTGYAEQTPSGPVATPKGKIYLLPPQRK